MDLKQEERYTIMHEVFYVVKDKFASLDKGMEERLVKLKLHVFEKHKDYIQGNFLQSTSRNVI